MRRIACCLMIAWCTLCQTGQAQERTRVAVTIDDLPAAGSPVPGWSEARILSTLASVLHAHHVPEAVGFFTGGNMDTAPDTRAALEAWLLGGFLLGNHTYSHASANAVDARTFERDIARN
ncbi:MAG TPA: polysaccharide deacetylase family protein, partial [Polyangiales bacterium]